jgi:hypothetical protein
MSSITTDVARAVGVQAEVLEYGKFCATPDGPIEPLAEYRILGKSAGFPEGLAPRCTPAEFGLSKSAAEMESLELLDRRRSGTVIWPVWEGHTLFYLCYRVGQRSEGGPRTYTLARYLCTRTPVNPWIVYQAMMPLAGLSREQADQIAAISMLEDDTEEAQCSEGLIQRVLNGLEYRRPIHAMIDDEVAFFRLCGTAWYRLTESQRVHFSCGWNVSPSIARRLVISFGPSIPENGLRLDPRKEPSLAPVRSKRRSIADSFGSVAEVLIAGVGLLEREPPMPNPSMGFDDPQFAMSFSGQRYEEALIQWMPKILESYQRNPSPDVVSHLLRFDDGLQHSLYVYLEQTILTSPPLLSAFAEIERQCRKVRKDWGTVSNSSVVSLAIRLQDAADKGRLADLLAEIEEGDLARSDALTSFSALLGACLSRMPGEQAIAIHRRLLDGPIPQWYRDWLALHHRAVVFQLLDAFDSLRLRKLSEVIGESHLLGIALAIADRVPSGADYDEMIRHLDRNARASFAKCLYAFWLASETGIEGWLDCFAFDLPRSLLYYALTGWITDHQQIHSDLRREFQHLSKAGRATIVTCLMQLSDAGLVESPLLDRIWADYLELDVGRVLPSVRDWQSPVGARLLLRYAAQNQEPQECTTYLLRVSQDGGLSLLSLEDVVVILKACDLLIGNASCYGSLDSLIRNWPSWTPLHDWIRAVGLRVGAWLLQRDGHQDVVEEFISLSPPRVATFLRAVQSCSALTEDAYTLMKEGGLDRLTLGWLATHIERQWGGAGAPGWEWIVDWARWTAVDTYHDNALRLLAGLSFDAGAILTDGDWVALNASGNASISSSPELALLKSILSGSFEIEKRPSDQALVLATSIAREDPVFSSSESRWLDLWQHVRHGWQRLFVLECATGSGFALTFGELRDLRAEMGWLKRVIAIRSRNVRDRNLLGASVETALSLLNKLELAAAGYQSCQYGDDAWSQDIADTPFIGAFRSVPMKFYTDDRFSDVLDFYYPDLKQRNWSAGVAEGLTNFVNGYAPDSADQKEALTVVERLFFRKYVWADPRVRSAILRDRARGARGPSLIRNATRVFTRVESVGWSEVHSSFSVAKPDGFAVDQNLKDLIELIVKGNGHLKDTRK